MQGWVFTTFHAALTRASGRDQFARRDRKLFQAHSAIRRRARRTQIVGEATKTLSSDLIPWRGRTLLWEHLEGHDIGSQVGLHPVLAGLRVNLDRFLPA